MAEVTLQDRRTVSRVFRKVKASIGPRLGEDYAAARRKGIPASPPVVVVAANTSRICLEMILQEMMPVEKAHVVDLADRIVCMLVGALPADDRAAAVARITDDLVGRVAERVAHRAVIAMDWADDPPVTP